MKHPQVSRLICLGFGLAGAVAWAIMAGIDISYGESSAITEAGKQYQPWTMGLISFVGFLLACGAGALFRNGSRAWAALMVVCAVAFVGYSAGNSFSFYAGETLLADHAAAEKADAQRKAIKESKERSDKLQDETLTWLKNTEAKARNNEKIRLVDKVVELASKPVEVKPVEISPATADKRAEVMNRIFGWKKESAQLFNSAWVVGLLLATKLLGPGLMFGCWPRKLGNQNSGTGPPEKPSETPKFEIKKPPIVSSPDALRNLEVLLGADNQVTTAPYLQQQWQCSAQTAHSRLQSWARRGIVALDKRRGIVVVTRGPNFKTVRSA